MEVEGGEVLSEETLETQNYLVEKCRVDEGISDIMVQSLTALYFISSYAAATSA